MAKFTISADTLEELLDAADQLRGDAPAAASEPPKTRQSRKKAEAPPPAQPETAPTGANPFAPAPDAAAEAPAANPFAPAPDASGAFAAAANHPFTPEAPVERPAVTKFKELLEKISAQHGEPSVYAWANKIFGLSPNVTKDRFLSELIHQQSDDALAVAYKQGGGQ